MMKFIVLTTLFSVPTVLGMEESTDSNKTSFLRGTENDRSEHRELDSSVFCGCSGCDSAAFEVYAGEHKCGNRIQWLEDTQGYSERDACAQVAGEEYPNECGVCDPDSCNPPAPPTERPQSSPIGRCGCSECDEDAWNAMAGDSSCGSRIEWLQSELLYEERDACSQVSSEEFPDECGKCDPSQCNIATPSTSSPTNNPTSRPTNAPTRSPTAAPSPSPTTSPTAPPTKSPTSSPVDENGNLSCGCSTCTSAVLDTFAGEAKCGDRISYLQNAEGFDEQDACSRVAGLEFPVECGGCDPDRCDQPSYNDNDGNNNNSGQKCGGAVNSSSNSQAVCQQDLWDPTGDDTMYCFTYGGSGDPCHLNNNNDPSDGRFKDPSECVNSDTFYLWDEPDTQGRSYEWAGTTWLEYSLRFPQQLRDLRSRGTKITSPLLKAGGGGVLLGNLDAFFNACGPACKNPNDPAYIDVIAINAFCGDFNGPDGCRDGASFIYNEAISCSNAYSGIPVYITNWSRLQTANPQDQVDAIEAIEKFFPSSAANNPVVERVYWFGATDFGGGSSNNFLTQVLADGSTLGERWKNKCDSL